MPRTLFALLGLALVSAPARADERGPSTGLVIVPPQCVPFWTIPGDITSPAGWDQVVSFASCIQDTSIARVTRAGDVAEMFEGLRLALDPSIDLDVSVVENGDGAVRVRAGFHLGEMFVSLITRARSSLAPAPPADPVAMRETLEPMLERPAEMARLIFVAIDRAVRGDPSLAPDPMTRGLVRAAREQAAILMRAWPPTPGANDAAPVLATDRAR